MKANELRIGNLINVFRHPEDESMTSMMAMDISLVDGVYWTELEDGFMVNVEDGITAIPLTEEWLLKFGFENKGHGFSDNIYYKQQEWCNWGHRVTISKTGTVLSHGFMNQWSELTALKYVHQLQNLYFALTGEELTITK